MTNLSTILDQLKHYHRVTYLEPLDLEFLADTLKDLLRERAAQEINLRFRDWPPSRVIELLRLVDSELSSAPAPAPAPAPVEPPAPEPKQSITPLPLSKPTNPLAKKPVETHS